MPLALVTGLALLSCDEQQQSEPLGPDEVALFGPGGGGGPPKVNTFDISLVLGSTGTTTTWTLVAINEATGPDWARSVKITCAPGSQCSTTIDVEVPGNYAFAAVPLAPQTGAFPEHIPPVVPVALVDNGGSGYAAGITCTDPFDPDAIVTQPATRRFLYDCAINNPPYAFKKGGGGNITIVVTPPATPPAAQIDAYDAENNLVTGTNGYLIIPLEPQPTGSGPTASGACGVPSGWVPAGVGTYNRPGFPVAGGPGSTFTLPYPVDAAAVGPLPTDPCPTAEAYVFETDFVAGVLTGTYRFSTATGIPAGVLPITLEFLVCQVDPYPETLSDGDGGDFRGVNTFSLGVTGSGDCSDPFSCIKAGFLAEAVDNSGSGGNPLDLVRLPGEIAIWFELIGTGTATVTVRSVSPFDEVFRTTIQFSCTGGPNCGTPTVTTQVAGLTWDFAAPRLGTLSGADLRDRYRITIVLGGLPYDLIRYEGKANFDNFPNPNRGGGKKKIVSSDILLSVPNQCTNQSNDDRWFT